MSSVKRILLSIGVLIAIVVLSIFMFTAGSSLFIILAGIGAVAVILIYDDYRVVVEKWESANKNDVIISTRDFRLYQKLKEDYKEKHPEDIFFDP